MNLFDFNLNESKLNSEKEEGIVSSFLKQLSNSIKQKEITENEAQEINPFEEFERKVEESRRKIKEKNNAVVIDEEDICIVSGIQDEKITLINPKNAKEFDIYISISDEHKNKLHEKGIDSNIYEMEKNDFYNLDLGSKLFLKNETLKVYNGEVEIIHPNAKYKLDEMYAALQDDENQRFIVKEVTNDKIFLTYENGGGLVSKYREAYPELEVGDVVKKANGKYVKE